MSHASDFRVGQRVQLTMEGEKNDLRGRAATPFGTVRRIGPSPLQIHVQRDGLKGTDSYHCAFWEPKRRRSPTDEGR